MMKRILLFIFSLFLLLMVVRLSAQQPDFSTAIDECQNSTDQDTCLGDVAYLASDISICTSSNDPARCRNTMAESVEILCLDQSDPQSCFGGWGAQGVESACTYLPPEDQATCFLVAAAQSHDYDIIDRRFSEGEERDLANAYVAVFASEPALLNNIDDNKTYDSAHVAMIAVMAVGQEVELPDEYCTALRGDWGGEYPEDAESNAVLCEEILAAVRMWQQADESEKNAILEDMLEALDDGGEEAALAVLRNSLFSDPLEDAFIRGWCRADDAGFCVEGAIPIMEYDAEVNMIVDFPRNGPPRYYEAIEDGLYRMYYDTEITNSDGEAEIVRWYGEIFIESPESLTWQFYNHLERSIGTVNYFIPLPVEESPAD